MKRPVCVILGMAGWRQHFRLALIHIKAFAIGLNWLF
jgi:hypothetical protein